VTAEDKSQHNYQEKKDVVPQFLQYGGPGRKEFERVMSLNP
jgi:hypothetical protein